jgi:hypothetical protein
LRSVLDFEIGFSTLAIYWSLSASRLEAVYNIDAAHGGAGVGKM